MSKKLKFSVNPKLINKTVPADRRFMAEGFISVEGRIEDLVQSVQYVSPLITNIFN